MCSRKNIPNPDNVCAVVPCCKGYKYKELHSTGQLAQLSSASLVTTGAGGPGFDSQADQIGQTVANGSLPLLRFFGTVSPRRKVAEMGPANCYTLRRNLRV